jgi:hypothetical protein
MKVLSINLYPQRKEFLFKSSFNEGDLYFGDRSKIGKQEMSRQD